MTVALVAGALVALIIIVALLALLWTAHRDVKRAEHYRERYLEQAAELAEARGLAEAHRTLIKRQDTRVAELQAELDELQAGPLVGRQVNVNTPNPDDQSFRGVCTRELAEGGLVLTAATYMDTVRVRGGELQIVERPIGDAVIPRWSWAQVLDADGDVAEDVDGNAADETPRTPTEE